MPLGFLPSTKTSSGLGATTAVYLRTRYLCNAPLLFECNRSPTELPHGVAANHWGLDLSGVRDPAISPILLTKTSCKEGRKKFGIFRQLEFKMFHIVFCINL